MKKQTILVFISCLLVAANYLYSQTSEIQKSPEATTALFSTEDILPLRMSYSKKELKTKTNDSTYMDMEFSYQEPDGSWDTIAVKVRARGNWRLKNCYFPPIKVKIKKSDRKGTIFKGNKKLKMVLPCHQLSDYNDNVIKEYMAYKFYEIVSPYHFKTRLVDLHYTESRAKKVKEHYLKGFFIEDIDKVAERHDGNQLKRSVHPLQQDNICCVQNDFFQYMIGNTDFSVAYRHNEKLIFVDGKKAMPVPYDFDMSGLVNANYAVVSQVQNETLDITEVTQRLFRGFKRNDVVYNQVRQQFLENKAQFYTIMDNLKPYFENPREFEEARKFISDFFVVLEDDLKYRREIVAKARAK